MSYSFVGIAASILIEGKLHVLCEIDHVGNALVESKVLKILR